EYEESEGVQNFLNDVANYEVLKGIQTNLYKCFLPQAWKSIHDQGVSAFLHPEGIYDDPRGGRLRREVYKRLRGHFQFQNEKKFFPIGNRNKFSINVFGMELDQPAFENISNLFVPATIDGCYQPANNRPVMGIKNEQDQWNIEGHPDRILHITAEELALFAQLYDEPGTDPLEARLPSLHARQLLKVLEKFAAQPKRLGDLQGEYSSTEMWHETNAQNDGTIRRETTFPESPEQWILSGPHFFVGNPLYKTPRAECTSTKAYDTLELITLPDDYLPRTNYLPNCSPDEYKARTPKVSWIEEGETEPKRVTEYYRLVLRKRLGPASERTMISALVPPSTAHVISAQSDAFKEQTRLLDVLVVTMSVVFDFFLKSSAQADFTANNFRSIPLLSNGIDQNMICRILSLICLTTLYDTFWQSSWDPAFKQQGWSIPADSDHPGAR